MTILAATKLETADYGQPYWVAIYNKNVDLLNQKLLKISALLDVDATSLADGAVLRWNSESAKWEAVVL
ncbi:hypothetical protein [Desulfatiglans anilini]|uniref:hypothetical protein n=1 Tax=Desulfatiglans anilini TaxID=90728 RepID=UPI0003F998C9|nr:hypothetical protein [Desulfatiglans anilini]